MGGDRIQVKLQAGVDRVEEGAAVHAAHHRRRGVGQADAPQPGGQVQALDVRDRQGLVIAVPVDGSASGVLDELGRGGLAVGHAPGLDVRGHEQQLSNPPGRRHVLVGPEESLPRHEGAHGMAEHVDGDVALWPLLLLQQGHAVGDKGVGCLARVLAVGKVGERQPVGRPVEADEHPLPARLPEGVAVADVGGAARLERDVEPMHKDQDVADLPLRVGICGELREDGVRPGSLGHRPERGAVVGGLEELDRSGAAAVQRGARRHHVIGHGLLPGCSPPLRTSAPAQHGSAPTFYLRV